MTTDKNLISRRFLSDRELDSLIIRIKERIVPLLKYRKVPRHCGICRLFRFCKIINHSLICPWLVNNGSYGKI